jgi:hypothetical protein
MVTDSKVLDKEYVIALSYLEVLVKKKVDRDRNFFSNVENYNIILEKIEEFKNYPNQIGIKI